VEALEFVTQTNPGAAGPYLAIVIERLSDRAPRVSWEAARVIANVASAFPVEAEAAIPGLLQNTQDEGTVVRWSAAFALAEIAMYVPSRRADLLQEMKALSEKEENNGVKNIYLKALKKLKARF